MKECSKSITRRMHSPNFLTKYFVGEGIDIGGQPDPLALYLELFPLAKSIRTWDMGDGDAQYLADVADASFDFVHSSHCLEHLHDPAEGLRNWFRILRPGGHLIVTVPDEDMYEQGEFPSSFNLDHKWTFTAFKQQSWSSHSVNVIDLVREMGAAAQLLKLEVLDSSYRRGLPRFDQTLTPVAEAAIEFVIRKRTDAELQDGGRLPKPQQVPREVRIHMNQYRADVNTLKRNNLSTPPFTDDSEL